MREGLQNRKGLLRRDDDGFVVGLRARLNVLHWILRDTLVQDSDFVNAEHNGDQAALFREQIRYTVEEHFRKQKRLNEVGIKVLSLFFIDRVENYLGESRAHKAAGRVDGLYPGVIRELFDEAFEELKPKYSEFADKKAADVRASYFAKKSRRGNGART
jgi:restriction endonuclease